MYNKMTYETARQVGTLIEELLHANATYNAYVYKVISDTDYLHESISDLRRSEVDATLELSEAVEDFMISRKRLISLKLGIEEEGDEKDWETYVKSTEFKTLVDMVQSIGDIKLNLISEQEVKVLNRILTGIPMDSYEIYDKIEESKEDVRVKMKQK